MHMKQTEEQNQKSETNKSFGVGTKSRSTTEDVDDASQLETRSESKGDKTNASDEYADITFSPYDVMELLDKIATLEDEIATKRSALIDMQLNRDRLQHLLGGAKN